MKNCDTCENFTKILFWRDGRKGLCNHTDYNISFMKGKPCKYHISKKYSRKIFKHYTKSIIASSIN